MDLNSFYRSPGCVENILSVLALVERRPLYKSNRVRLSPVCLRAPLPFHLFTDTWIEAGLRSIDTARLKLPCRGKYTRPPESSTRRPSVSSTRNKKGGSSVLRKTAGSILGPRLMERKDERASGQTKERRGESSIEKLRKTGVFLLARHPIPLPLQSSLHFSLAIIWRLGATRPRRDHARRKRSDRFARYYFIGSVHSL